MSTAPERFTDDLLPRQRAKEEVDIEFELPLIIVDTPTPLEKGDGTIQRMWRTRSFRAFYRAANRLSAIAQKSELEYEDISAISGGVILLSWADQEAEKDPNVTPDMQLRIKMTRALAFVTGYSGKIIAANEDERMQESFQKLFFGGTHESLAEVGIEVLEKYRQPKTEHEATHFAGFEQEVTFHLLNHRKESALRFSTSASAYDDYFRDGTRFDAMAHNLKIGRERSVPVQIKTHKADFSSAKSEDGVVTIYGKQDLRNVQGDPFWADTMQADSPFPTLTALIDEAAGETVDSAKLDEISRRLHSRIFS